MATGQLFRAASASAAAIARLAASRVIGAPYGVRGGAVGGEADGAGCCPRAGRAAQKNMPATASTGLAIMEAPPVSGLLGSSRASKKHNGIGRFRQALAVDRRSRRP